MKYSGGVAVTVLRILCFLLRCFSKDPVDAFSEQNIRLNKVFRETHSRRKADSLIAEGRVRINGEVVEDMGRRVVPFRDVVELDGQPYTGWEVRHGFSAPNETTIREEYIKFWKPIGATSTTDRSVPGNLLEALENSAVYNVKEDPITQRIFSVGRLDKDSSGLLILTSDGRLPNAVLRKEFKSPKSYRVMVDRDIADVDVARLRRGLVITTDVVRQGKHRSVTAQTLPCQVERCGDGRVLKMTLTEGRNRQIRVMLKTLGYSVIDLHRTEFLGIDLSGLRGPGDWTRLNDRELQIVHRAISRAEAN